ncbi:uncharacterized protein Z518_03882 [Rhinocladiella mackenziei CBS 650.93]|uniref:Uncharacterized protein n=1 Tax=Rhinocladiella mackenziei CBS 650.93 TaxID=1442369 RepID=A0A0D2H688_9EURO|nr:uncharacterized protein Z518_03882 [Rhinocladiella mackenziei CBS 650.93]KIX05908.1 hypothetical protein Z518_03882 [Rhinocladiella mackenziei CBS 650.93]
MYRHSAQVNCMSQNGPPSPDNTSDSESDIIEVLDQKRKQLDEEIFRFKAAKEREFREFERDLRVKRKRSPDAQQSSQSSPNKHFFSSSSNTASVLNLLASVQNGAANGWRPYRPKRYEDGTGDRIINHAPLSKPTLSLDKLNISGETLPLVNPLGTPPTPSILTRSVSRSPSPGSANTTPPRPRVEQIPPPTPTNDKSDCFAGVFTPTYLPLLESRDRTPLARSPRPEEERKRLQLDADAEKQEQHMQSSQSLPSRSISSSIVATKRTQSTPQLPSTSLPSALRSSSGGGRKRKHVTFQLADSKVVEPSSSYEEMSSPEMGEKETSFDERLANGDLSLPEDEKEEEGIKRAERPNFLTVTEKRRGRGRRFVSPVPSPLPSPSPSPTINGSTNFPVLVSPDESGFSGGLMEAEDGGSGVGFFELDEELASPGLREGKPFTWELESAPEELDINEKMGTNEVTPDSFTAGSVPIDIVKPHSISGSWVGSFGH